MTRRHFLVLLAVVSGLALAGRVAFVLLETQHLTVSPPPEELDGPELHRSFDEVYYVGTAIQLANGKGFRGPAFFGSPDEEAADHPPLTSLALAPIAWLTDGSELAMRLSMAVLGTGVVVVAALIGRHVAGPAVGIVTAGVAAVYPNLWVNDGLLLSETVATLCTAATILLTYRLVTVPSWSRAVLAGAACGVAMLSRSELALLVPLLLVPAILLRPGTSIRRRCAIIGVAALMAGAVVAPWVAYNLSRFDEPVFLSTGDGSVLSGANCHSTYYGRKLGFWDGYCGAEARGADPSVRSVERRRMAFSYIGDHLGRLPVVVAARLGRGWGVYQPIGTADNNQLEGRPLWVSLTGWAMLPLLLASACFGVRSLRRRRVPIGPLVGPVLMTVLVIAAFYGIPRFRVPAEVSIVVLASVGVVSLNEGSQARRRSARVRRRLLTSAA